MHPYRQLQMHIQSIFFPINSSDYKQVINSQLFEQQMCSKLFQIYQKRTPTFLAEAVALISSLLMLLRHSKHQCFIESNLNTFYLIVFVLSVIQLLLKLVVFAIIYSKNREIANKYNTVILILMAIAHLGLWIYSITLLTNEQLRVCHLRDQFFVKNYVFIYGAMILGGLCFFAIMIIPAVGVTLLALNNIKKEKEAQQEGQI